MTKTIINQSTQLVKAHIAFTRAMEEAERGIYNTPIQKEALERCANLPGASLAFDKLTAAIKSCNPLY